MPGEGRQQQYDQADFQRKSAAVYCVCTVCLYSVCILYGHNIFDYVLCLMVLRCLFIHIFLSE